MKAFLCHSSQDKEFVRAVADQLGIAKIFFDQYAFEPGQDFRQEIQRHLDDATLFVFFVSRASLESAWCQYEIDNADLRRMNGKIKGQLAFLIDREVTYSSLPSWLGRGRAITQPHVRRASRDIQNALMALVTSDQRPFIGRNEEMAKFAQDLAPWGANSYPQVIVTTGLEGVGRRTMMEQVVRNNLRFNWGPTIVVTSTMTVEDVYLILAEETGGISSAQAMRDEAEAFRSLDSVTQVKEIVNRLRMFEEERTVPCFVDEGGILTEDGYIVPELLSIAREYVASSRNAYLAFLLRRRPAIDLEDRSLILLTSLRPLSEDDTRLLLLQLCRAGHIGLEESQVREFVEYLDGYPPAAYFLVELIREYGAQAMIANKSMLEDFKAHRFERLIRALELTETQWQALDYLTSEPAVPMQALACALDIDDAATSKIVVSLIDLSVVTATDGIYSLASPVRTAVSRVRGVMSAETYNSVAERLLSTYWNEGQELPDLAIIDATLRAMSLSGRANNPKVDEVVTARYSTLHRIARDSYDREEYSNAILYARQVLARDPGRPGLADIVVKSLVRLRKWPEAHEEIDRIRDAGKVRHHFLRGFALRRQGKQEQAVTEFEAALRVGDTKIATHRELAYTFEELGRYSLARTQCSAALTKDRNNPFLLDLSAKIYIAQKDFPKADPAIRALQAADPTGRFADHRWATYWMRAGDMKRALDYANKAVSHPKAKFPAFAQRVNILIELGHEELAQQALQGLIEKFPREEHDVKIGLRVKALARRGHWREGREVWEGLRSKDRPVHQALLKALYMVEATDDRLSIVQRNKAKVQAERIAASLDILDDLGSMIDEDFE